MTQIFMCASFSLFTTIPTAYANCSQLID